MNDSQTSNKEFTRRLLLNLPAVMLAFIGLSVTIGGAVFTYITQAQIPEASLWPLPGLMLVYWVILGGAGFLSALFCFRRRSIAGLRAAWIITGSFIPLIILEVLSIAPFVLITFLLFTISTIIFASQRQAKWFESFGLLMLGSICNLGILLLIITLSNRGS